MKEHLFIASVDHAGRPRRGFEDNGASFDLDFDGIPDIHEVSVNRWVALQMEAFFTAHSAITDFVIMSDSEYSERHKRANRYGADAYLALHINSHTRTDVNQGLFFYDHRTKAGNGDRLARLMADEWRPVATELLGKPLTVKALPTTLPAWKNPHYTIKGLKRPVGICCEPWFLSNPAHRRAFATPEGMKALAECYGRALLKWAQSKTLST